MGSNRQGWGAWSSLVKCVKYNLNLCGSLIVAILSGNEFQYFIVLGKKEYVLQSLLVWMVLYALLLRCRVRCKTG